MTMLYLIIGIIVLVLLFVSLQIHTAAADQKLDPDDFIVRAPHYYTGIGALLALSAPVGLWLSYAKRSLASAPTGTWVEVWAILTVFFMIGAYLTLVGLRKRLHVRGDALEYRRLLGKSRCFYTGQITWLRQRATGVQICIGQKKVCRFDYTYIGYTILLQRLAAAGLEPRR